MKDSNKRVRTFLIFIVFVPLCFYVLPKVAFHGIVCRVQDSGNQLQDILFWEFCPEEKEQWYENLFWEECTKQDQQIPPNTEVLISACTDPEVRGVPDGEVLFVHEKKTGEMYSLDLRTGAKRQIPSNYWGIFLSSELVWLHGSLVGPSNIDYRPHYILDLREGQKYALVDLQIVGVLDNGEPNPIIIKYLTEAEQIFINPTESELIILAPNFRKQIGKSVIIPIFAFNPNNNLEIKDYEVVENLLKDLKVDYKVIDFSLRYVEVPSPTGKYVARQDGIYYAGTEIPLITREYMGGVGMSAFVGWYYDEHSVLLTLGDYYYYYADDLWGPQYNFPLPRPILKLNLPTP